MALPVAPLNTHVPAAARSEACPQTKKPVMWLGMERLLHLMPHWCPRYNIRLWKTFTDCFNCLPVAALIDEKVGRGTAGGGGSERLFPLGNGRSAVS